jgi:hypothetical protein
MTRVVAAVLLPRRRRLVAVLPIRVCRHLPVTRLRVGIRRLLVAPESRGPIRSAERVISLCMRSGLTLVK